MITAPFFSAGDLTFRPLVEADVPVVARWLSDPRVIEWWNGVTRPSDEAKVHKDYFDELEDWASVALVELDGRPVGLQEWYPLAATSAGEREKYDVHGVLVDGAYGIDQLVGEADLHGRGIGTRQVEAIASWLLGPEGPARLVVTAPIVENARAVHVYEKAGFRAVSVLPAFDELDGVWRDCLLMERRPPE